MPFPVRIALVFLQVVQVIFLAIHDWIQIGSLNNTAAALATDGRIKLVITTIVSTLPFAFGLALTIMHVQDAVFPSGVKIYLIVSYALLLMGQLTAWWIPYLVQPNPKRAERYRRLFANTTAFLPERNGMVPNALHVLGKLCTGVCESTI